jgi:hypothetical protein
VLDALVTDYGSPALALTAVQNAGGGVLRFPVGVTALGATGLTPSGAVPVVFRGAGRGVSTLQLASGASSTSCVVVNAGEGMITVEDLTLDANNGANCNGLYARVGLTVENVDAVRHEFGCGIFLQGAHRPELRDVRSLSRDLRLDGRAPRGIRVVDGADIRIHRPELVNLYNGIDLSGCVDRVMIVDPHCEGSWYTLPTRLRSTDDEPTAGQGTWTADGLYVRLTDAGAFPDVLFVADPHTTTDVRLLLAVGTATVAAAIGGRLYASGSPGMTSWWERPAGELVRVAVDDVVTAQGIVVGVVDDTHLVVEGWHDPVTLAPCAAPQTGTLTGYRVATGGTFEVNDADSVRTYPQWLDGTPIAASELAGYGAALTYEVLIPHGNYSGIQATDTVSEVTVVVGTHARSWSDQISLFGPRSLVVCPRVLEGQDTGLTINGANSVVVAPVVRDQGRRGLFGQGPDLLVLGGDFSRTPKRGEVGDESYDSQLGLFGARHTAIGVVVDGEDLPKARDGFAVSGTARLIDCASRGHSLGSVKLYGAAAKAELVRGRYEDEPASGPVGKIRHVAGATVGTYTTRNADPPHPDTETANGGMHIETPADGGTEKTWRKHALGWQRVKVPL